MLRKDDGEWGKKYMDFVDKGVRFYRLKRTWKEVVEGDIKTLKLSM